MDSVQQLFDYVKKARGAGMTAREIREELLAVGWTLENIREALASTTPSALSAKKAKAVKTAVKTVQKELPQKEPFRLEKFEGNPIIGPDEAHSWESKFTFNPGAFYEDGKVHLLYRAVGASDVSVLGYAASSDGITIDERFPFPAYSQTAGSKRAGSLEAPISYLSGGGWNGGCEDPRLTLLGGTVYLIYTAFDGWAALRLALTSMPLEDFKNKAWKWKKPVFISPPGEIHKNWVLFPEKINGKYAILHTISPHIGIEYVDSMDKFDGKKYIKSYKTDKFDPTRWDSSVRGAGPPPLKTKDGWLLFYHATDHRDPGKYKLGAMLLDLSDPTKVLSRSKEPILEPVECYENEGFKSGVVYSCGAVAVDGTLFLYYGGADSVVCVATADLEKFLGELRKDESPKLKKTDRLSKK